MPDGPNDDNNMKFDINNFLKTIIAENVFPFGL